MHENREKNKLQASKAVVRYLSEESPADQRWDSLKSKGIVISDAYSQGSEVQRRRGKRCYFCSSTLLFSLHSHTNTGDMKHKLKAADFCRVRLEPVCMQRKSLRWKARFHKAWPVLKERFPTARYIHLVLTVRNCHVSELRQTLKMMNEGWRRMTNRKTFPATGFLKAVEVTREMDYCDECQNSTSKKNTCKNKSNHTYNENAHPHIHAILQVPASYFSRGYIPQEQWAQIWKESLRVDYTPVVWLSVVKPKKGSQDSEAALTDAVKETTKYPIKFDDLVDFIEKPGGVEWFLQLDEQLEKTRAVALGGSFREVMSEEEPTADEMLRPEDEEEELSAALEYREYLFRNAEKKYALQRIFTPEEYEPSNNDVAPTTDQIV